MPTKIVNGLNQMLADEMVFYQKLRNFHWNVKGPAFFQLHAKFEQMYTAEALSIDRLAERIRALGARPKSTMAEYLEASRLKEQSDSLAAEKMVAELQSDLKDLVGYTETLRKIADEAGDDITVALLDDMSDVHQKDAWMLKAWLG